ncbi:hypothetical protein [Flavobacterium sp. KACC 22763]|uniref:hypothetical protein n=1 Tax=Flavobacterium sp. KACC 22763 TaxID=3025668 RepID=UPI0023666FC3|nr:hypothetical protein [Flavobacterium sp. KACC 22763]WDF64748.1 hypothetical protein PQ463_01070 [Flavobacterium sp. KACC 22763]
MKRLFTTFLLLFVIMQNYAQKKNSETRQFIENAEITQINKDWNVKAEFRSGLGEILSFFPVEAIDLKSNNKMKSLQMDMTVIYQIAGRNYNYFKSSWIDLDEIDEFVLFIEQYVIPNLKDKTEKKQSTTYIFNSREITFSFNIEKTSRRVSIYLKDNGVTDNEHYFWTETQVGKIPELLTMLKEIK